MAKIGINLDGFKPILNLYEAPLVAMNKLMAVLSMERISLVGVTYGNENPAYSIAMIDFIHKVTDKTINTYVELNAEMIHQVIGIKPKMITLTAGYGKNGFLNPVDIRQQEGLLREIIQELSAHDIVVGVLIDPDVEELKKVHRTGFEYIELNTLHFSKAINFNDELNELHRIREIANMAVTLGMGVNVRGDIGEDNISELGKIETIEDIILGDRFFKLAIFRGFKNTVDDFYRNMNL